jgi:hypothetical protein
VQIRRDKSDVEKKHREIDDLILKIYEEKQKRIETIYGIPATYPYKPRNIWNYLKQKEKTGELKLRVKLTPYAIRCALERLVKKGKLEKERLITKTGYRLKTSA